MWNSEKSSSRCTIGGFFFLLVQLYQTDFTGSLRKLWNVYLSDVQPIKNVFNFNFGTLDEVYFYVFLNFC